MKTTSHSRAASLALAVVLWPLLADAPAMAQATAQDRAAEQRYCAALLDRYLRYASTATEYPGTPGKIANDSGAAIAQAQCQAGDTDAGIRILERKLRDSKVSLPPRS